MARTAGALATGLLVVVLAACGSSSPTPAPSAAAATSAPSASADASAPPASAAPSVAPSASASAAPSPSASAGTDVAAEFSKAVTDKLFRPHIEVKSVATVLGQTVAIAGTVDVNYGVSHSVMVTVAAGKRTTSDTISTDTKTYEKKWGQWTESTKANSGSNFAKLLGSSGGFTDAGMDTRDGVSLHHLTLTDPSKISGAEIGLAPEIAASAKVSIEGWADDTGKPIAMRVTASWDQPLQSGGTTPAQMVVDMAFTGSANTVLEPTPDEVWVLRTSKYFKYKMAVPSTWVLKSGSAKYFDMWKYPDGGIDSQVGGYKANGWTTNSETSYAIKNPGKWADLTKAHATKSKSARVAGAQARTFMIWGTYKGVVWYEQVAITSHGGKIYTIILETSHKPTAEDEAKFASLLASFSFK